MTKSIFLNNTTIILIRSFNLYNRKTGSKMKSSNVTSLSRNNKKKEGEEKLFVVKTDQVLWARDHGVNEIRYWVHTSSLAGRRIGARGRWWYIEEDNYELCTRTENWWGVQVCVRERDRESVCVREVKHYCIAGDKNKLLLFLLEGFCQEFLRKERAKERDGRPSAKELYNVCVN